MQTTNESADLRCLEGPYLQDLLDQARAVKATLAALTAEPGLSGIRKPWSRIILTGMGSSYHALHPIHLQLIAAGHTAMMVETAELLHAQTRLLDGQSLLVAVSQSGRSAETLQMLDFVGECSPSDRSSIIGVTNSADAPLAHRADVVIPLSAGREYSVSCKTYMATLVGLQWLCGLLLHHDPDATRKLLAPAADELAAYLVGWPERVRWLSNFLAGTQSLFLTGRGASLAAVGAGALILKESTRVHAEGMSVPAFRHGPLEMCSAKLSLIAFEGEAATAEMNRALVTDVRAAGGIAAWAGPSAQQSAMKLPLVDPALRPLFEMAHAQMISLALAVNQGQEPGRFRHATKITTTP